MPRRTAAAAPLLTMIYDGRRRRWRTRIALYRLEARRAGLDIAWHDLADAPDALAAHGIGDADVGTLFAIDGEGAVFEGAAALALLWSALPSHRRLGYLLASPVPSALADLCGRLARFAEPLRPPRTRARHDAGSAAATSPPA